MNVPIILFLKGIHHSLEDISNFEHFDALSIDWTIDPEVARKRFPNKTLQGNLDPCALFAPDEKLKQLTQEMLNKFGTERYIANLGHGLLPSHSPEKVGTFINLIHEISISMVSEENRRRELED